MYATKNWLHLPSVAVAERLRRRSCDQKVPSLDVIGRGHLKKYLLEK